MQASWNQWGSTTNSYAPSSFSNAFPPAPGMPNSNPFSVPPTTTVNNPTVGSQFPNVYGQQQAQSTQQQWQQWEQWQQQYAQWQQQYGDKFQGSMQASGVMPTPNAFPNIPPLPPSAPSAQPPPPDSIPPIDKNDESHKRSHDGSSNEDVKKQKTGKGKETLESLIESEKTFDQQFKSWEASFLQWKEQNVNHPDKTQYKEYESKCESYREQLLQKREVLRKKRENKEAEVAAATASAKEAALATSSAAMHQSGYNTSAAMQNNPYMAAPPNMMYPPMPSMYSSQDASRGMPPQAANAYMPNYSMYSMPPPPNLPPMTAPLPLSGAADDDMLKKGSQSLEFLSASSAQSKSIPGLDLVGTDKVLNSNYASNLAPNSSLFSAYNQDITKPLHTSEDKPFNFPRPVQNYDNNNTQNQYSYPPGRSNFEDGSRMNHSNRNVPHSQFERANQGRDGHDRFSNRASIGNDRFNNQPPYQLNEYGRDYKYRKNESDTSFRNDDRNKHGANNNSSFTPSYNSDKYAKYLEDEYDDSRFRDPEPDDDYSKNRSDFNRDQSYRNNYQGRQNYRNDRGSFFGQNRGGDNMKRDFNDRNMKSDFNNKEDGRTTFNERGKEGGGFGGFNRGGGRGHFRNDFGRSSFGREKTDDFAEKDNRMDVSKPISLLDLPLMKPPDDFEKFQSPGMKASETFDNKFQQGMAKLPEAFDTFQPSPTKPESFDKKVPDISYSSENGPARTMESKNLAPVTEKLGPVIQDPFVASQVFEYNHTISEKCADGEVTSSFEPIYVFDYSHGKKKLLDPLNLMPPKSDLVTELISQQKSLFKNDQSWDGESWNDREKGTDMTPLPERNKNIPSSRQNVSSTSARPDSQNTIPVKDEKNNTKWLHERMAPKKVEKPLVKLIDDLLFLPGRNSRPPKIAIIFRGPPGSGKSYTAKLIKDKEVEMNGSAPRILSLDDYFAIEDVEVEKSNSNGTKEFVTDGVQYNYDASLEPSYMDSLVKSFRKNVLDGFFPFIIVDCVNEKLRKYEEMYCFAKSRGFQVYICEMNRDLSTCIKQNIHGRSEKDIAKIIDTWEPTPSSQTVLDIENLLKSTTVMEVDLAEDKTEHDTEEKKIEENTDASKDDTGTEGTDTINSGTGEQCSAEKKVEEYCSSYTETLWLSKWDKSEQTEEKLARLDGVNRKRSTSFKEWLQLPEERDISWYTSGDASTSGDVSVPKKKRVRWADLEERMAQQKMRDIGFVVGYTDWNRMMDPSFGGNKLTQTKYI